MNPEVLFSPWGIMRKSLIHMVDRFKEEELAFQPFENSWSVRKIFLHVAESEEFWLRSVLLNETSGDIEYDLTEFPDRASIKRKLDEVHARSLAYLKSLDEIRLQKPISTEWGENLTPSQVLWHVIEHECHHHGELSLCLGLLGRKGWGP